jgi:hypothetical protein
MPDSFPPPSTDPQPLCYASTAEASQLEWRAPLAAALTTCVAALFNGFPLTYPDTGNYLGNAIALIHLRKPWFFFRPLTYGAFLTPFATPFTIWLLPFAQGLLVAVAIRLALRTAGIRLTGWVFVGLLGGLSVLTSLSWFSGQIMPDVFTPIVILLAFVMLWAPSSGGGRGLSIAAAVLTLAIATHLSHFPLYTSLLTVGVVARLVSHSAARSWRAAARLVVRGAVPLIAALGIVIGPNYLLFRRPVLSRSSSIFALGHLIGTGAAQRYLERACPAGGYALCAERQRLRASAGWFLWDPDGPVARSQAAMTRGDSTLLHEAPLIVAGTVRQEWPALLWSSVRGAKLQLVTFGLDPGGYSAYVEKSTGRLGSYVGRAYRGSRQAKVALPTVALTRLHYAIVCAGLSALLVLLPSLRHAADRPFRAMVGIVLLGIVINAVVVASLSDMQPRYQGRVIWLVPLLGAVAVVRWIERGRPARKDHADPSG